jgi:hypothetical protein
VGFRVALTLAVLAAALPASAHAYAIAGSPWPEHKVGYYNADAELSDAVSMAVRAWNGSGIDVRFVRTTRSRAHVVIRRGDVRGTISRAESGFDSGACSGVADIGRQPRYERASVVLDRRCSGLIVSSEVVAHELGHVLGLGHAQGTCSVMSATPYALCQHRPRAWQFRCGYLERDDLRGAARLYGGRTRKVKAFCPVWDPPKPPTDLTVTKSGTLIQLSWINPAAPVPALAVFGDPFVETRVVTTPGPCASATNEAPPVLSDPIGFAPERPQATFFSLTPGVRCYSVQLRDEFGRGSAAHITFGT